VLRETPGALARAVDRVTSSLSSPAPTGNVSGTVNCPCAPGASGIEAGETVPGVAKALAVVEKSTGPT
jgi:hypothetical protein